MTTTPLFEDRFRPWDQLTEDEQEQIRTHPEHRNEDHARYRWKSFSGGDGPIWEKRVDRLVGPPRPPASGTFPGDLAGVSIATS